MPEGHGDIRFEQHRGEVESKHNPLRKSILRREGIRSYPKGMTTYASNSTVEGEGDRQPPQNLEGLSVADTLAERRGFEPLEPLRVHLISNQIPSATRTPLHPRYHLFWAFESSPTRAN